MAKYPEVIQQRFLIQLDPIIIQLKKTKDRVLYYLKKYPAYRDNDERLIANYWQDQLLQNNWDPKELKAYDFLKIYAAGIFLTSADLITRARAKLEETNPEIRGKSYEERARKGKIVSQEIYQV